MNQLSRRKLGSSGPHASVLGFGCASYWAHPRFPESSARAVLERALALGVNFFDTGASYAGGMAETRLGRLLREAGTDPHELLVATKVGTLVDADDKRIRDFRASSLAGQVTASLERLAMERVTLLQLHGPQPDELTDELLTALERERTSGRALLLGVNGSDAAVDRAVASGVFDVVMPFLSVIKPGARGLVNGAARAGTGVVVAEPLGRMLFAPPLWSWLTSASGLWYLARALARDPRFVLMNRLLRRALRSPGWTPAQLAFRWVLDQTGVTSGVVGSTRPAHLVELAAAAAAPLPPAVARELDELLGNGEAPP